MTDVSLETKQNISYITENDDFYSSIHLFNYLHFSK